MAIIGAAMIAAGVMLPWFSLFAGLQPVSALGTLNGTLLLVAAGGAGTLGGVTILRDARWTRRLLVAAGIGLTAFSAYLLVGLVTVFRQVSADPLLVAQLGPGLALVAAGSVLILATALLGD
jgi:hypothetical protein